MAKNALILAREHIEKEEWAEAYEISAEYFADETSEEWEILEGEDRIELVLLKINCVIKAISLGNLFSHLDDNNLLVWKEEHNDIMDLLLDSISELEYDILCIKNKNEKNAINKLQECFSKVDHMAQQHFLLLLDYSINSVTSTNRDKSFSKYVSYNAGYNCLSQRILINFYALRDTLEISGCIFENLHYQRAQDIKNDKLFARAMEIWEEISEQTNDFPYFVDDEVGRMYLTAKSLIEQALISSNEEDLEEKNKKIVRLKEKVALNCDFLNAIWVIKGQRASLCCDMKVREEIYSDILKCEKEIQEYESDYSHPPVNKEMFSTIPQKSSGGCYVATAVYGSYDCPEVWTLRRYRDYTLAETWYGRAFIRTYYAISPTLVKWFGHTEWFKKMWQGRLDCLVAKLHSNGFESTPYEDKEWK